MSRPVTLALLAANLTLATAIWAVTTGRLGVGATETTVGDAAVNRSGRGGLPEVASGTAGSGRAAGGVGQRAEGNVNGVDEAVASGASPLASAIRASGVPPLFRAAVLPPPVEEPAAPPPPDPPLRLLGVIIGATGAIAVMQVGDAPPIRLRVQDEIDGWTATRIEVKRVVMQKRGNVSMTVRMDPTD